MHRPRHLLRRICTITARTCRHRRIIMCTCRRRTTGDLHRDRICLLRLHIMGQEDTCPLRVIDGRAQKGEHEHEAQSISRTSSRRSVRDFGSSVCRNDSDSEGSSTAESSCAEAAAPAVRAGQTSADAAGDEQRQKNDAARRKTSPAFVRQETARREASPDEQRQETAHASAFRRQKAARVQEVITASKRLV